MALSDTYNPTTNPDPSGAHWNADGILKNEYDVGSTIPTTPGATPQTVTGPTGNGVPNVDPHPTLDQNGKPIVKPPIPTTGAGVQIVPGVAQGPNQINVVDTAGQVATDPSLLINGKAGTSLTAADPNISKAQIKAGDIKDGGKYQIDANGLAIDPATGKAVMASQQKKINAVGVNTFNSLSAVEQAAMLGVNGTVDQNALIDANGIAIDTNAVGAGQGATGQALNQAAQQKFTSVIDTNTLAGKMLADQLGEGNYTDSKATVKGQLDILQQEFTGPSGEPTIPSWAAGTARNVNRIAAFKGMSGTAAVAAMSQALMEASLPIAQADATFFQTLTVKNLDNRQEQTINKANVLAKFDLANMDMRMTAAVENANKFMQMDMKNLDNDQQAAVINTQARVQSILEDAKAENTNRLFVAQSQNEKDMYYSGLSASIDQFNVNQKNSMIQANMSSINAARQFNAGMENNREQFYKNMQFQIDSANAKWRQTVTLSENAQAFEAAATDVKNKVGISTEMLNRIWDRSDSLLDYAWKSSENERDRQAAVNLAKLQGDIKSGQDDAAGAGNLFGMIAETGLNLLLGAFGIRL